MRFIRTLFAVSLGMSVLWPLTCLGVTDDDSGGAREVYLYRPDRIMQCIDPTQDNLTLTVASAVVRKEQWWQQVLETQNGVAVLLNITVSTSDGKTEFLPEVLATSVKKAADNQRVYALIEHPVLDDFQLSDGKIYVKSIDIKIGFVDLTKDSPIRDAVNTLSKVIKTVGYPSSPFTKGIEYFSEYSSAIFDPVGLNDVTAMQKSPNYLPDGEITMYFAKQHAANGGNNTRCVNGTMMAGGKAIILPPDSPQNNASGYVSLDSVSHLCWDLLSDPTYEIRYGELDANQNCPPVAQMTALKNPHLAFNLFTTLNDSIAKANAVRLYTVGSDVTKEDLAIYKQAAGASGDPSLVRAFFTDVGKHANAAADIHPVTYKAGENTFTISAGVDTDEKTIKLKGSKKGIKQIDGTFTQDESVQWDAFPQPPETYNEASPPATDSAAPPPPPDPGTAPPPPFL